MAASPPSPLRPTARWRGFSRRDFIYPVVLLALVGRSNWFLILAAIGAPIYFALVLFAARAPARKEPRPAPVEQRSLGPGRVGP